MNKALHAADAELEKNTHKLHGMHAEVGKAYVVPVSMHSSLAAQGVTHVIHVLGPNMNPERPLCLKGNYDLGCTLLAAAYTSLFNSFLQIKSSVAREMSPGPQAKRAAVSPTKVSSSAAPKGGGGGGIGGIGGIGWADLLMDYIRHPEKHQGEMYACARARALSDQTMHTHTHTHLHF